VGEQGGFEDMQKGAPLVEERGAYLVEQKEKNTPQPEQEIPRRPGEVHTRK